MVMTVSWRKGVNLWSFARCQHRGVLAEDFERTRVILRGNDEALLAHVGRDLQCGFNRFRKRARCDRFSGLCETDQRKAKARHNMSDAIGTGRDTSLKLVTAVRLLQNST